MQLYIYVGFSLSLSPACFIIRNNLLSNTSVACFEIIEKLYVLLHRKSFDNTVVRKSATTPITDVAYVRYLLALKMWKKMDKISDKKEKINNIALSLLGLRMPKLRNELLEFVPRPPTNEENETLWLLQSNSLDLKQAHKYFLLFEDKMDDFADLQRTVITQTGQSCSKSQVMQFCPLEFGSFFSAACKFCTQIMRIFYRRKNCKPFYTWNNTFTEISDEFSFSSKHLDRR